MNRERARLLQTNIATFVVSICLLGGFSVWFVGHSIDESNKPLCNVVSILTQPSPVPPAQPTEVKGTAEYVNKYRQYVADRAVYDKRVGEALVALRNKNCNQ